MYDFNIEMKYCRYCGERIESNRVRCPYCASLLNRAVKIHIKQPGFNHTYITPAIPDTNTNTDDIDDSIILTDSDEAKIIADSDEAKIIADSDENNNLIEIDRSLEVKEAPQVVERMIYNKKLSNSVKVFLTVLFTILPLIGNAAGIITGTILMASVEDEDRRTFGNALFVSSLILFILFGIVTFIIYLGFMA